MLGWLTSKFATWRLRAGQKHALVAIDGRTLADLGLNRVAVNAARGGPVGLLVQQTFD